MNNTGPMDAPLLVVAPGMTLSEVVAASTVALDRVDLDGKGVAQPREPHRVLVRDPRRGIELPAGRFSIVDTDGPIVVRLRATPHLEAVPWAAALGHVDALAAALEKVGWKERVRLAPATLEEHLRSVPEDRVGRWHHGAWETEVWIRRIVTAGTRLAELLAHLTDAYLVTIVMWDERLCGYPSAEAHGEEQ